MDGWLDYVNVATAVVTAASLVANLTPTKADDAVVATIAKVVNLFALNWRKP